LQEIAKIYVAASFTITSATDTLSSQIEPLAPKTSERFKAMELLAHKGIYTGVTLMPILPFINDTKENIQTIIHRAKDSGASYILPMFGVTLRKGSREYFYSALDKNFPGVKAEYQKHFGDQYACYSSHYRELSDVFFDFCGKLGIATQMQFYQPLPDGQLSLF
jgi:DNA repair photolyase